MFPGQGAQTVGMGKDLYDKYEEIREVYKKASEISGKDIAELTFNSTMEELSKTENTQLAIATMSLGILKVLENKGIKPDVTVGLSLGEYPALISGGYLSFEDGITLLKHRGYLMGNKVEPGNYSMAAIIGLDSKIIEEVCAEIAAKGMFISPANYNYSGQTVISGDEEAINLAIEALKEKGAKRFGIHAFLASNTVTNDYYPTLAKTLFETVVEIKEKTGVKMDFINLSGGVGIPYRPGEEGNDIRAIGEGVRRVYEEVLVPAGMGDVAIYTEMGRFMMGPYGCLVTTAIHEKHTHKEYIGVDACAVNLMRPAMYGAYHHITVMGKEDAPCDHTYDVTGSLCENNDKFAIDRQLPKIDMGDLLVLHDTGAHGFAMGYNYNGKLKSAEILLKENGDFELIRRAETPKDYFATFDCFDILKDMKDPYQK